MSNPKFKNENYTNFGGINTKYSPYLTQPMEFLSLQNFDFQIIGALTQRWGSSQYIGQTFPGSINTLFEFQQLNGNSQVIVGATGGVWAGATQTTLTGFSLTLLGATQQFGFMAFQTCGIVDTATSGPPVLNFRAIFADISTASGANNYGFLGVPGFMNPHRMVDDILSISVLNNFAFMADGNKYLKYDGTTTTIVSLPPVANVGAGGSYASPSFFLSTLTTGVGWPATGTSGAFLVYLSYVNNRGFEGPLTPIASILSNFDGAAATFTTGGSFISYYFSASTPPEFGISAINQYVFFASGSFISNAPPRAISAPIYAGTTNTPFNLIPLYLSTTPASGSTITWVQTGTSIGNYNAAGITYLCSNVGTFYEETGYFPINGTFINNTSGFNFNPNEYGEFDLTSYYPRFTEVYQNRMFLAGFSLTPSLAWFSDATEPEGYDPDFNFEVRTNDADYLTGMKAYAGSMYFFKKNSFHQLTGDSPNNFLLQQVSSLYGAVNDRCIVIYDDIMLFLDRKGVIQFNGAGLTNISIKVQNFFDRMNYNQALLTACMSYDKLRNQILISIPIDGSTTNNLLLVYDHAVTAWTTYTGIRASVFANMQGVNPTRYPFYGDYSGRVNIFSPTMLADNNIGPTLYLKTRFMHDLGNSITKQFRRLYLDNSVQAATFLTPVNFYQDYGPSIVAGSSMNLGVFQDRIDFGIAGKAVAFELYAQGASSAVQIYGYTMEERLQRKV